MKLSSSKKHSNEKVQGEKEKGKQREPGHGRQPVWRFEQDPNTEAEEGHPKEGKGGPDCRGWGRGGKRKVWGNNDGMPVDRRRGDADFGLDRNREKRGEPRKEGRRKLHYMAEGSHVCRVTERGKKKAWEKKKGRGGRRQRVPCEFSLYYSNSPFREQEEKASPEKT